MLPAVEQPPVRTHSDYAQAGMALPDRLTHPPTEIDHSLTDMLMSRHFYEGSYGRDLGPFIPNHNCVRPWQLQVQLTRETERRVSDEYAGGARGEPLPDRYERELPQTVRQNATIRDARAKFNALPQPSYTPYDQTAIGIHTYIGPRGGVRGPVVGGALLRSHDA